MIILALTSWLCASIFIMIGIYSIKRKPPMHFWAGTTVKKEEIADVKLYNKANGIMWICYGLVYVVAGVIALFGKSSVSGVIIGLACFPGLIVLILVYQVIYKKYKVK
ncbi:hypothetical protein SAMN05661008_01044 [Alkalithermobacter thermoalcaliphilus JW-YL-7 = DSM 7308]|uniref:DUF3784 domain-containing protein n=1 Tax=Alkalithermobacter thermoalcaliphilus JW-YL-7 = DSM 7308 TaxID=1121328 RepID=A0A150FNM3_CLOPD|nr:hypothetical protein JWYL7_0314 [[Clostridium] paradoxum JW-YL-7 = DSM 7308]SHK86532.1 hypothetical protein SAMN05661008_01044 [[Clostridium] paradoxum JW-YL-7 = DSM 7308]